MMVKLRLIVPLLAALVVCASAGFADDDVEFHTYIWDVSEWQCENNPFGKAIPTLLRDTEWGETWTPNGSHVSQLTGAAPPEVDPAVSESVRNRGSVAWTDWHVEIINGTYTPGSAVVYNKNAPTPQWVIEDIAGGFFAHVVSGMNTQVDYYEVLSIYFEYTVDNPSLPVSIKEYPTTEYMIPEPGSILGVLAGCLALGFRLRRRA